MLDFKNARIDIVFGKSQFKYSDLVRFSWGTVSSANVVFKTHCYLDIMSSHLKSQFLCQHCFSSYSQARTFPTICTKQPLKVSIIFDKSKSTHPQNLLEHARHHSGSASRPGNPLHFPKQTTSLPRRTA